MTHTTGNQTMTDVSIAHHDKTLTLTLTRANKKNAFTQQMYIDLANAINFAQHDHQTRVIVIQGSEGCFTAGNDMHDFASIKRHDSNSINGTEQFMIALMESSLPVVAKVEGLAIGIGTTLLLHCDFVYATPDAKFMMPFINLGLVPEYASSYILPRLTGHVKAAEWLMLGETFSAQDARDAGMINAVIAPEDIDQKINQVVAKLVALPRISMMQTKQLLKSNHEEVKKHVFKELEIFVSAMHSDAAQEAFSAFIEKRQPDFSAYV